MVVEDMHQAAQNGVWKTRYRSGNELASGWGSGARPVVPGRWLGGGGGGAGAQAGTKASAGVAAAKRDASSTRCHMASNRLRHK